MFTELQKLIELRGKNLWSEIYEGLESAGYLDNLYLEHTRDIDMEEAMKRIDNMSFEECCTWLTWILRGNRFSEGLFEMNIENGNISRLLKRAEENMSG